MDNILIPNNKLLEGSYLCLCSSVYFLGQGSNLFKKKAYQASIPFLTICVEESLKGSELALKFRGDGDVNIKEWKKLITHKFKLSNLPSSALDTLRKMSKSQMSMTAQAFNIDLKSIDVIDILKNQSSDTEALPQFKKLRELCFYVDWNKEKDSWMKFSEIPESKQNNITYYVLREAMGFKNHLEYMIERGVNTRREKGIKLVGLPFPAYNDVRAINQYESTLTMREDNRILIKKKYDKGREDFLQVINSS
jgi:AbiV family abortive infection protein